LEGTSLAPGTDEGPGQHARRDRGRTQQDGEGLDGATDAEGRQGEHEGRDETARDRPDAGSQHGSGGRLHPPESRDAPPDAHRPTVRETAGRGPDPRSGLRSDALRAPGGWTMGMLKIEHLVKRHGPRTVLDRVA